MAPTFELRKKKKGDWGFSDVNRFAPEYKGVFWPLIKSIYCKAAMHIFVISTYTWMKADDETKQLKVWNGETDCTPTWHHGSTSRSTEYNVAREYQLTGK